MEALWLSGMIVPFLCGSAGLKHRQGGRGQTYFIVKWKRHIQECSWPGSSSISALHIKVAIIFLGILHCLFCYLKQNFWFNGDLNSQFTQMPGPGPRIVWLSLKSMVSTELLLLFILGASFCRTKHGCGCSIHCAELKAGLTILADITFDKVSYIFTDLWAVAHGLGGGKLQTGRLKTPLFEATQCITNHSCWLNCLDHTHIDGHSKGQFSDIAADQDCTTHIAAITAWIHHCAGHGNPSSITGLAQSEGLCFGCRGYLQARLVKSAAVRGSHRMSHHSPAPSLLLANWLHQTIHLSGIFVLPQCCLYFFRLQYCPSMLISRFQPYYRRPWI